MSRETRNNRAATELRVARAEGGPTKLSGHAAVFGVEAEIGGYFRELMEPGAFRDAIERDDVRALFNHDSNFILGRNRAGTLRMSEDNVGLLVDIDLPDAATIRDLVVAPVERGDVSGMSIAFVVLREEWDFSSDVPLRSIREVELYDVSVVTFPAYEQTDVALRSLTAKRPAAPVCQLPILRRRLQLAERGEMAR